MSDTHTSHNRTSQKHLSDDILSMNFLSNGDFSAQRPELLQEVIALKHLRRVSLGPDMTVVFESPRLIWWHIQEMLRIEQGGDAQLQEEWEVYSALIPSANSITLTLMIEIMDPIERKKALVQRRDIERNLFLEGAGFRIQCQPIEPSCHGEKGAKSQDSVRGDVNPTMNASVSLDKGHVFANNEVRDRVDPSHADRAVDAVSDTTSDTTSHTLSEPITGMVSGSAFNSGAAGSPPDTLSHLTSSEQDMGRPLSPEHGETHPTSSVHFLRFILNQGARHAFALGEPVLSCHHPHALYRAPISTPLWNALCQDMGITPLKY